MKEKIEKVLAELEIRLKFANNELKTCPEGTLSYVKRGGRGTFFQIINSGGKRLRKSINKAPDFIRGLARKEYLIKEKKLLEHNIKVLKDVIKTLVEPSPDNVLKSISKHLQGIPKHYFFLIIIRIAGPISLMRKVITSLKKKSIRLHGA